MEVGDRLGIGRKISRTIADSADKLDADVNMLSRMRLRLKSAALSAGGRDWTQLFREQDRDQSGQITWDEFHTMCRKVLNIADHDTHLKAIFEKLDGDQSGEISIDELIEFVADPAESLQRSSIA